MANLTWKQLKEHIEKMPVENLTDNVAIYLSEMDEYFTASDVFTNDEADVLSAGESYIAVTA